MKKNVSIEFLKAVDFEMEDKTSDEIYLFPMMGRSWVGEKEYDVEVSEPYGGFLGFGKRVDLENCIYIYKGIPLSAIKIIETPKDWIRHE